MFKSSMEFLDIAKADIGAAKILLSSATDDVYINISAYQCQQALKKCIKVLLFENRLPLLKSHKIDDLLGLLEQKGVDIDIFDSIREEGSTFTR